jgi:hypothetical protein
LFERRRRAKHHLSLIKASAVVLIILAVEIFYPV